MKRNFLYLVVLTVFAVMVMVFKSDWLFEWPFHRLDAVLDMFKK